MERWAKGKFSGLHSQSVQQTIAEFLEAVNSTRQQRTEGNAEARYPWRTSRYRDVTFTNQAPRFRGRKCLLPCGTLDGKRAYLSVPLPKGFQPSGNLCEVRLEFGKLALVDRAKRMLSFVRRQSQGILRAALSYIRNGPSGAHH